MRWTVTKTSTDGIRVKPLNCFSLIFRISHTCPISWYRTVLTLSPLSFWSGLFHLRIWICPLLQVGMLAINQDQNGKPCGFRWDGSLWTVLSISTLFERECVSVYRIERVKIRFSQTVLLALPTRWLSYPLWQNQSSCLQMEILELANLLGFQNYLLRLMFNAFKFCEIFRQNRFQQRHKIDSKYELDRSIRLISNCMSAGSSCNNTTLLGLTLSPLSFWSGHFHHLNLGISTFCKRACH